jgi:hypothetical protein
VPPEADAASQPCPVLVVVVTLSVPVPPTVTACCGMNTLRAPIWAANVSAVGDTPPAVPPPPPPTISVTGIDCVPFTPPVKVTLTDPL